MIKFFAWHLTNSNAILTDALESIVNVVAGSFAREAQPSGIRAQQGQISTFDQSPVSHVGTPVKFITGLHPGLFCHTTHHKPVIG